MYCCLECGHIFSDDEVSTWRENRGEYWGESCYESVSGCPYCKGDYVRIHKCDACGEWIEDTYIKLNSDKRICENCYTVYEIGEE